jgi:hypothetical protein
MRTITFLGLVAAAVLLLAACGASSSQAAAAASRADSAHVWHQAVQCVREHGLPTFPEPSIDSSGRPHFPQGTQEPPPSVLDACQHILEQLPSNERQPVSSSSSSQTLNDPATMLRFAQCMRRHGITDWPDPDASGVFHMPPSMGHLAKGEPRWPSIQRAWRACLRYDPSGGVQMAAS